MSPTTRNHAIQTFAVLALLLAGAAGADTYNVDRFDDSTVNTCSFQFNDCALRGAIIAANNHPGDDTVLLHTGTYTLSIAGRNEDLCQTGDLDVRDALVIQGDGPERTIIDADGLDRVLHVLADGERLTVSGVTITGGNSMAARGGGVLVSQGGLRLEVCVVSDNVSQAGGGAGAGVADDAWSTYPGVGIQDSWITGNSGPHPLFLTSEFYLSRSMVSANVSSVSAVLVLGFDGYLVSSTVTGNDGRGVDSFASEVVVSGSTLVGNSGAELALFTITEPPVAWLSNSLIGGTCDTGSSGIVNSWGGNLESPGDTCGLGALDLVNVPDPMLTGLGWFGGPTPVHHPLPGSPAVDQPIAVESCPTFDQRSLSRPLDGDGNGTALCDIGAVELAGAGELFVETFDCGFTTPWSDVVP